MTQDASTLQLLADLLSYPTPGLAARAAEGAVALAADQRAAAGRLARFAAFARSSDPGALEEAYTAAFDLAPLCSPYVGDQLFGASRERAYFLSGLAELRREAGLPPTSELPDHVSEVLRLVAALVPGEVRGDLVRDGLAPCLKKLLAVLDEARHPWADVLAAAVDVIDPRAEAAPPLALEATP